MNKMILLYYSLFFFMMMIILIYILTSLNMDLLILTLLMYSILICIVLSFWSKNYIFSIIMFLTMVSGLLVIFLYFTSLISNLKKHFNMNILISMSFLTNMTTFFYTLKYKYSSKIYYNLLNNFTNMESYSIYNTNEKIFSNIMHIYHYPFNNFLLLSIFFLIISLFSIIKMCSIKNSALRKIK